MIPIDGAGVYRHLLTLRDFTQQFTTSFPHVAAQHRKSIFRNPYNMIRAVPYRMAATLEALHPISYALSQPAKAGGLRIPEEGL